jgi:hypothetical protein
MAALLSTIQVPIADAPLSNFSIAGNLKLKQEMN